MPRQLKNSKVLITGGAGFIGSNLCDSFLKAGNTVVCLDNLATGSKENISHLISDGNFSFLAGDIRDFKTCKKAMEGVDIVLHQAALGSVPRSINDPLTSNEVNITGFLNILHAAKEAGVRRLVYAASSSTYGDSKALPKVEDQIGMPLSPYAVTKYVNELYAQVYGNLFGMEIIGLRYFNVFGKRQTPDGAYAAAIPRFVEAFIRHHSPTIHGDGLQTRDFTYIENVVQMNHLAATVENKEALNQVYNVAYGERTTLLDLIEIIREALVPFDSKISEVALDFGPSRAGDVRDSLADVTKAKTLLGYEPSHSLKAGIVEAIDWYWDTLRN
ncbi:SDR family oxidoreductase [Cryomorpha ignava]|uniref:SDR family oxidoreductase n=1 Tax=Cryomorpha ignava TaxID=101383 RepID=A0A7K3WM61_9FLAO|nr:SDR family oxidoreductase [Cryomorpha ignava]NEN22554.1 SDR family oxidoreductase [Cryomorpha ignava]